MHKNNRLVITITGLAAYVAIAVIVREQYGSIAATLAGVMGAIMYIVGMMVHWDAPKEEEPS